MNTNISRTFSAFIALVAFTGILISPVVAQDKMKMDNKMGSKMKTTKMDGKMKMNKMKMDSKMKNNKMKMMSKENKMKMEKMKMKKMDGKNGWKNENG